jgi:NADPH-dependent stearoyl-CoA 9-desaturase
MSAPLPIRLNDAEIAAFGREVDAIYNEVKADLGARDARYIRRLISTQRRLALGGRLVIFASLAFLPTWAHALATTPLFLTIIALGTLTLGLAKILENMEIGHNVMHGQWDWLRDPQINSRTWEWDSVCPSALWKHSHNVVHHNWTNVLGLDRDLGYGPLRVADEQRWHPGHLAQPISNALLALFFEWAVAFHDVRFARIRRGEVSLKEAGAQFRHILRKIGRQVAKDYVLWPLLAGPFFLYVCAANCVANLIRNVWAYTVIFCGHFPTGVYVFTQDQVQSETRGRWYVRQVLGSCNIEGGKLFHLMSGNLDHQIEHHLFSDLPSNRYAELAPRVRALCARYGLPYNSGSLTRQFGTTTLKILRLALPPTRAAQSAA